ncbi:toll/interleukin-1 receptor domain-containing protein [Kitasatospora aureofaciens]|uniref:toll/interleukin-1 receptor domain-containing protein n=1 Tax=Kitasatospora aureofaciens TaxID=1894 RepID=UPI0005272D97|nr:toll/interleukin-1 receptor domain-containing protein [Kitasatospora aureofaciens]
MPRVFLSFRKADSRWMRDRLHQALADRFGSGEIFKSGGSIPVGADFAEVLRRQAAECELMLVLIGPAWLDARNEDGTRRLDRADDWVRVEIRTALQAGNRVVPVLLGDATMLPGASELPSEIADLAQLQFVRVSETHLADELERLCADMTALLPALVHRSAAPAAAPAAEPTVTMKARASGGGSVYQAARDQTINPA